MSAVTAMMRATLWKSRWWLGGVWLTMLLSLLAVQWDSTGRWHMVSSLPWFLVGATWLVWLRIGGFKRSPDTGDVPEQALSVWWHKPLAEFAVVIVSAYIPAIIADVCIRLSSGATKETIFAWLLGDVAIEATFLWIVYNVTAMRSRYAMVAPIVFWSFYTSVDAANFHTATWPRDGRAQLLWLALTASCALATFWRPRAGSFVFASLVWFGWCGNTVATRTLPNAQGRGEGHATRDELRLTIDSVSIERKHVLRVAFHIDATVAGNVARLSDGAHVKLDGVHEQRVVEVVHPNQPSNLLLNDMGDSARISDAVGLLGVWLYRDRDLNRYNELLLSPVHFRGTANSGVKRAEGVAVVGVFDVQPVQLAQLSMGSWLEISDVVATRRVPVRAEANPRSADSLVRLVRSGFVQPNLWGLRRTYFVSRAERIRPLEMPERNGSLCAELRAADGFLSLLPLSTPARHTAEILPALYHQINDAEILLPASRLGRAGDTLVVQSLSAAAWYSVFANASREQLEKVGRR